MLLHVSYICDADLFRYICLFVLLFSVVVSYFCGSLLCSPIMIGLLKSNYRPFFSFTAYILRILIVFHRINLQPLSVFWEIFTSFVSPSIQCIVMFAF